ncbi:MAG: hypothetical protein WCT29_03170 [Candidatus Paceibacterota bacterium]|jgi:hypothetical protein
MIKKSIKILRNQSGGYALLELLFYVSFFAALSLAVVSSMLTMTGSFKETALYTELAQSSTIMERIVREIRLASDVSAVAVGDLKLNTTNDAGQLMTIEFLLSGTDVRLLENDIFIANLNSPRVQVNALSFTQITTAQGKAIQVSMTVQSQNDNQNRTYDFSNTVVLRGSY